MRSKFGIRTILIPVLAVIGFYLIQMIVAIAYLFIVLLASAFTSEGFDPSKMNSLLMDVNAIIIKHSNNISGIYAVIIILLSILVIRSLLHSNPNAIRREKVSSGEMIAAALVIIGASGATTLLMTGIQELGKVVPFVDKIMNDYIQLSESFVGSGNIAMVIITTCIIVPIAEDLVFRGIIQGELRRVMPGWTAVIIQAVIFALVHGNPIQITYVLLPAIILGAVYEWTKSIYMPIGLHMLFNFTGAAVPMMLQGNENATGVFVIFEFAMIPFAIIAIVYLFKKRKTDTWDLAMADGVSIHSDPSDTSDTSLNKASADPSLMQTDIQDSSTAQTSQPAWKHNDLM